MNVESVLHVLNSRLSSTHTYLYVRVCVRKCTLVLLADKHVYPLADDPAAP